MRIEAHINRTLDALARPCVVVRKRPRSAFKLCGFAGLACALGLGSWLAVYAGLSLWVLAAVALSSVLAFLGLALATKIVAGVERLVYYHQQTGVLVSAACVL